MIDNRKKKMNRPTPRKDTKKRKGAETRILGFGG